MWRHVGRGLSESSAPGGKESRNYGKSYLCYLAEYSIGSGYSISVTNTAFAR